MKAWITAGCLVCAIAGPAASAWAQAAPEEEPKTIIAPTISSPMTLTQTARQNAIAARPAGRSAQGAATSPTRGVRAAPPTAAAASGLSAPASVSSVGVSRAQHN